jgi:anti-anti-sigma factor
MIDCSTLVVKLPKCVDAKEMRAVMKELRPRLKLYQIQLTFDCSQVQHMDTAGADMLLHCMVAIAKRDGSLKLDKVSLAAATVLELMGLDRLFTLAPDVGEPAPKENLRITVERNPQTSVMEPLSDEALQEPAAA